MLVTVLPKLTNLKVFRCQMSSEALGPLLRILETNHPNLRGLAIAYVLFSVSQSLLTAIFCRTTSSSPPQFPALRSLNRFVYSGKDDDALLAVDNFLSTQTVALHTLVVHHTQIYPAPYLPTSSLRNLFLTLSFSKAEFLSQLLIHGQELECLRLEVNLEHGCLLSSVFRSHAKTNSFPALRKLSFVLNTAANGFSDRDLFPAVAEFVRAHPMLDALCMSNTLRLPGFGFDAAVWGMLPSLSNLRTLSIDVPKDLHFALSAWLIPRGVTALELRVHRPASTPVIDLTVRYPSESLRNLIANVSSNYRPGCQADSSSFHCLLLIQKSKVSSKLVSRRSASYASATTVSTPFTPQMEKRNWNDGQIGERDSTSTITWNS